MKPPRLPGAERFRFCDKNLVSRGLICEEQPNGVTSSKLARKDSFLLQYQARSCSNESLLCPCSGDHSHTTTDSIANSSTTSCVLEELISQTNNLPGTRYDNKRKPNLPITSRLTSRVFNLTNCHLNEERDYFRDKGKDLYEAVSFIPGNHFPDGGFVDCSSSSRSSTPTSLDSTGESLPKLAESKCRIHSVTNLRLLSPSNHAKLLINSTSHASLMSDESSISSTHQTECDDSLRSCSCSPVEHWAKAAAVQNRLSSSSQSSWEDGSALHDVT